jgi:hypothetical protein
VRPVIRWSLGANSGARKFWLDSVGASPKNANPLDFFCLFIILFILYLPLSVII